MAHHLLDGMLSDPVSSEARRDASRGFAGDLAGAGDLSAPRSAVDLAMSLTGSKVEPDGVRTQGEEKEAPAYVRPDDSEDQKSQEGAAAPATTSGRGFAGLGNQGATCYMNSLLQTLFMTPEFRRLIYSWVYDREVEGQEEDCIPLQLQKLFGMLQLTRSTSVSTRALTKSFQWTSAQSFQQHDVQELMRVLLDALERSLRASGHPTPTAVNDLFKGTFTDYIRTATEADFERFGEELPKPSEEGDTEFVKGGLSTVQVERQRDDPFMDLSLVIKPFGASKAIGSIEESLARFITPELICGKNSVEFEELGGARVPVVKGLKIARPPYLLTLQLKRFDLDYSSPTLARVKLNDKVSFPSLLNMNLWVGTERAPEQPPSTDEGAAGQPEAAAAAPAGTAVAAAAPTASTAASSDSNAAAASSADTAGTDVEAAPSSGAGKEEAEVGAGTAAMATAGATAVATPRSDESYEDFKKRAEAMAVEHGPFVYELYAVLVHSGGASGGHYFVYIKDLESGQWRNFNDSSVTDITMARVVEAYGGSTSYSSVSYTSSTNAYMLMYRRMTFDKVPLPAEHMPDLDEAPQDAAASESTEQAGGDVEGGGAASVPGEGRESGAATVSSDAEAETQAPAVAQKARAAASAFSVSRFDLLTGRAATFPSADDVPEMVRSAVQHQLAAELEADLERQRAANTITIIVVRGEQELKVPIERTMTVQEVTKRVWELFGYSKATGEETADKSGETSEGGTMEEATKQEGSASDPPSADAAEPSTAPGTSPAAEDVPLDCVRLREYRTHSKLMAAPFDGDKLTKTVNEVNWYSHQTLGLEVRQPDASFEEYDPSGIHVKVSMYNPDTQDFSEPFQVSVRRTHSLAELKRRLERHAACGVPAENQRIIKMSHYGTRTSKTFTIRALVGDEWQLTAGFYVHGSSELFVEDVTALATDAFDPFQADEEPDESKTSVTKSQTWVSESREAVLAVPAIGNAGTPGLKEGMIAITEAQSPAVALYKRRAFQVKVKYSKLDSKEVAGQFLMDSRATVGQLRERLASLAGTNTDHLLLEKVHPHSLSGISMRDDKVALDDMYFQDGTLVRLQTGERMQPGQVKAKFSLYKGPFPAGTSWVTEAASSPEEDDESVPEHLRGWRSHGGWAPKPLSPEELAAASKPPPPPRSGAPTEDVPAAEESVDKQGGAAGAEASEGQAVTEETSEDAAGEKDGEAGSEDATGDAGAGADGKEAEDAAEEAEKEAAIAKAWAADPSPYNGLEDVSIEQFATLPLSKEESVSTVKARVVQRLIELGKAGPETTPAHLRIRQRPTLRCTRIFPDGSRIKDTVAHVWENQEFCVELLPSPEKHMTGKAKREEAEAIAAVAESEAAAAAGDAAPAPAPAPAPVTYSSITSGASCADEDDVVVVVAWFDRARYKLTTPREMRFLMGTPVKDAVEEAARLAGIAKPENVSWILNAGGKVELFHVRNLLFKKCSDASSTFSLKTKYVRDGHLLLLQDTSVPLKALSEAEMAAINPHAGYTYVPRTQSRISGTYTAPYRPREAGLKIGVRIEQDAQGASGSGEEASASAAASAAPAPAITQHQDLPGSATGTLGKSEADLVREAATRARLREEEEAKTAELGEEPIYGDFDLLGGF